jgi:hypothetical protein
LWRVGTDRIIDSGLGIDVYGTAEQDLLGSALKGSDQTYGIVGIIAYHIYYAVELPKVGYCRFKIGMIFSVSVKRQYAFWKIVLTVAAVINRDFVASCR